MASFAFDSSAAEVALADLRTPACKERRYSVAGRIAYQTAFSRLSKGIDGSVRFGLGAVCHGDLFLRRDRIAATVPGTSVGSRIFQACDA